MIQSRRSWSKWMHFTLYYVLHSSSPLISLLRLSNYLFLSLVLTFSSLLLHWCCEMWSLEQLYILARNSIIYVCFLQYHLGRWRLLIRRSLWLRFSTGLHLSRRYIWTCDGNDALPVIPTHITLYPNY